MTNKEAIKILKGNKRVAEYFPENKELNSAIDKAIKALEQEECEDCISLKQALSDLDYLEETYLDGYKYSYVKYFDVQNMLNALPSVKPKRIIGKWNPIGYDGYADDNPVYDEWECSECGYEHYGDEETLTVYCPNCGAKMEK